MRFYKNYMFKRFSVTIGTMKEGKLLICIYPDSFGRRVTWHFLFHIYKVRLSILGYK